MGIRVSGWLGVLSALCAFPTGAVAFELAAPAKGAVALGSSLTLDIRDCKGWRGKPGFVAYLDGRELELAWTRGAYKGQWHANIALSPPEQGTRTHMFELSARCGLFRSRETSRFFSQASGSEELGQRVAANFMRKNRATKLTWDWGPAVFLYGLQKLDPDSRYLHDYHEHWVHETIPAPDRSDLCPPALSALELLRTKDNWVGLTSALTVAEYLRTEPRNSLGALNHLGHSSYNIVLPDSIWLDSLMMYAVFAVQWGSFMGDHELVDFGARQPAIFASVLQDPTTGLFRHAWLVNERKPVPQTETFWLRGNGWVLVSIAEILDELPADDPRRDGLIAIFRRLADGLLPHQLPTGLWDSIANLPGFSYPETSGTALVSYALAHGVHHGWLPSNYLAPAKKAFAGVSAMLQATQARELSLPYISGPTNPTPRWMYKFMGPKTDIHYGVGAFLMSAVEMKNERF